MDEALRNADSINELRLRFKLSGQMDKPQASVLALEEKVEEDETPA
jgi:Tfp pilus assembly ATPase PilU